MKYSLLLRHPIHGYINDIILFIATFTLSTSTQLLLKRHSSGMRQAIQRLYNNGPVVSEVYNQGHGKGLEQRVKDRQQSIQPILLCSQYIKCGYITLTVSYT